MNELLRRPTQVCLFFSPQVYYTFTTMLPQCTTPQDYLIKWIVGFDNIYKENYFYFYNLNSGN